MGEVKSTLDLVMERTRHLSLSAEEKAEQQREAFEKRLQGLLQQYADDALSDEALQDRITALQKETAVSDRHVVIGAIVNRVDPDGDNQRWLALLAQLAPSTGQPLHETLVAHRQSKADLERESAVRFSEVLAKKHGIHGSAIVPNPLKDDLYRERLDALKRQTQTRIEAITP